MGAVLAFELAFSLESAVRGAPRAGARPHGPPLEPLIVFASGTDAPSRRDPNRYRELDTDEAIVAELERLAGTPAAVLADAELMELALPILRADFAACAAYGAGRERRIRCPIQVFGGALDTTTPDGLGGWRDHTSGECSLRMFSGGHFFIHEELDQLLEHIVFTVDALRAAGDRARQADAPLAGDGAGLGRARASLSSSLARDPAHG
jgi:surfactin synthase thioesterase subunit